MIVPVLFNVGDTPDQSQPDDQTDDAETDNDEVQEIERMRPGVQEHAAEHIKPQRAIM
jgi:hypothetical protein